MIKRKYAVLSLLTLVSIMLGSLLYSNLVSAQGSTVTGYVSVPAAAFTPLGDEKLYGKNVSFLISQETDGYFYANLQLPHGATVTNMTVYLLDANFTSKLQVELWGVDLSQNGGWYALMAKIESPWDEAPGHIELFDDTIDNAKIDNQKWIYALEAYFDYGGTSMQLHGVFIEYTLPSQAVGGFWIPVDKFSLLSPYIALTLTIILAVSMSVAYIKHRKKQ